MKSIAQKLIISFVSFCSVTCAYAQQPEHYSIVQAEAADSLNRITNMVNNNKLDSALYVIEATLQRVGLREDCFTQRYALLDRKASVLARQTKYTEAIEIENEVAEAYASNPKLPKSYLCVAWNNLAAFYSSRANPGDLTKAIEYGEKSIQHLKKKSQAYVIAYYSLASYYSQAGMKDKAEAANKMAKKAGKDFFAKNPMTLASVLSDRAINLARSGDYLNAAATSEQALDIFETEGQAGTLSYCKLLLNTAAFYNQREQYAKSMELLEKARPLLLSLQGESGNDYIRCLSEMSSVHNKMGNLEKADDLINLAENQIGSGGTNVTRANGKAKSKLADIYAGNGNFKRAIEIEKSALEIYRALGDSLDVAYSYTNLASFYSHLGEAEKAEEYSDRSLALYNASSNATSEKADALNTAGTLFFSQRQYDRAYECAINAMKTCEAVGDTLSSRYAKICSSAGLYCYYQDNMPDAVAMTKKALDIQRQALGEEHPDNVNIIYNLAVYNYMQKDPIALQKNFHKAFEMQSDMVRHNFAHLPSADRERYWNMKKYVFRSAPELVTIDNVPDTLAIDVYNALLFTKGILLNSEVDFRSLLKKSASPAIQKQYAELSEINSQLENAYASSEPTLRNQIPSLRRQAEQLEREVVKGCKEFGDFTQNMSISVDDIAASLNDDEVAMEIFDVNVQDVGTTYMAMFLRKGYTAPKVVRLFSQRDLDKLPAFGGASLNQMLATREGINTIFSDTTMTNLVWEKLTKEWEGVNHVYFAPSGIFYQWGVEYLACADGSRMTDKFRFHRLSSTKLIAQRSEPKRVKHAAIFGGVEYDIPVDKMLAIRDFYRSGEYLNIDTAVVFNTYDDEMLLADTRAVDMMLDRGMRLNYLPGTLEEATMIGELMMMNDVETSLYTGAEASEEAFHLLSGSDVDLLHIATHGFSLNPSLLEGRSVAYLNKDYAESDDNTDAGLNYSGLMLAGANNVLNKKKLPSDLENGVLTAKEISKLDLHNLAMVVLSACQTGLGEVKEDGVFGLQRGFKKAGAQTLVMSLWSVNDAATSAMMQAFYTNMSEGTGRSDAFYEAQRALREGDFTEPYYWASFIMLDELE